MTFGSKGLGLLCNYRYINMPTGQLSACLARTPIVMVRTLMVSRTADGKVAVVKPAESRNAGPRQGAGFSEGK